MNYSKESDQDLNETTPKVHYSARIDARIYILRNTIFFKMMCYILLIISLFMMYNYLLSSLENRKNWYIEIDKNYSELQSKIDILFKDSNKIADIKNEYYNMQKYLFNNCPLIRSTFVNRVYKIISNDDSVSGIDSSKKNDISFLETSITNSQIGNNSTIFSNSQIKFKTYDLNVSFYTVNLIEALESVSRLCKASDKRKFPKFIKISNINTMNDKIINSLSKTQVPHMTYAQVTFIVGEIFQNN